MDFILYLLIWCLALEGIFTTACQVLESSQHSHILHWHCLGRNPSNLPILAGLSLSSTLSTSLLANEATRFCPHNVKVSFQTEWVIENIKYSLEHYRQKRESPPVGFEPNASHLPDEHPTARPQRIPVLLITYPSDLLCSHWTVTILFTRRHLRIPSVHVLPLYICSAHLSGWSTII